MNFLERHFRSSKQQQADNMKVVNKRKPRNQEMVYNAVREIKHPCTGREVAARLGFDSASVTNRLAELVKKGRLKVAFRLRSADGIWRNFYIVDKTYHEQ